MKACVEKFFRSLDNPNFLTMKLLNDVFNKMDSSDDFGRKIVDNIDLLSQYNIILDGGIGFDSYYDLDQKNLFLPNICTEYVACHEFGHMLLEFFEENSYPEEFPDVMKMCRIKLFSDQQNVSELLEGFKDELVQKSQDNPDQSEEFFKYYPEEKERYLEKYNGDVDAFLEDVFIYRYGLLSLFDKNAIGYNIISSIIDSIWWGSNPFFWSCVDTNGFPRLLIHGEEYFFSNVRAVRDSISFEEQFAEYLVLRLYGDELNDTTDILRNLIGDEWFSMMDKYYENLSTKIEEKGKVYKYKN